VAPFTKIAASNGVHVVYTEATTTSAVLHGRANTIERVSLASADGILTAQSIKNPAHFCLFCDFSLPAVEVQTPMLDSFSGENAVRFEADRITRPQDFTLTLANGSHGAIDIDTKSINVTLQNASQVNISGSADTAALKGENGTYISAEDFSATNATITTVNASYAEIGKTTTLNATANNGATIRYTGTPELTQSAHNGSRIESTDPQEVE
jgi:hypothetical protein